MLQSWVGELISTRCMHSWIWKPNHFEGLEMTLECNIPPVVQTHKQQQQQQQQQRHLPASSAYPFVLQRWESVTYECRVTLTLNGERTNLYDDAVVSCEKAGPAAGDGSLFVAGDSFLPLNNGWCSFRVSFGRLCSDDDDDDDDSDTDASHMNTNNFSSSASIGLRFTLCTFAPEMEPLHCCTDIFGLRHTRKPPTAYAAPLPPPPPPLLASSLTPQQREQQLLQRRLLDYQNRRQPDAPPTAVPLVLVPADLISAEPYRIPKKIRD